MTNPAPFDQFDDSQAGDPASETSAEATSATPEETTPSPDTSVALDALDRIVLNNIDLVVAAGGDDYRIPERYTELINHISGPLPEREQDKLDTAQEIERQRNEFAQQFSDGDLVTAYQSISLAREISVDVLLASRQPRLESVLAIINSPGGYVLTPDQVTALEEMRNTNAVAVLRASHEKSDELAALERDRARALQEQVDSLNASRELELQRQAAEAAAPAPVVNERTANPAINTPASALDQDTKDFLDRTSLIFAMGAVYVNDSAEATRVIDLIKGGDVYVAQTHDIAIELATAATALQSKAVVNPNGVEETYTRLLDALRKKEFDKFSQDDIVARIKELSERGYEINDELKEDYAAEIAIVNGDQEKDLLKELAGISPQPSQDAPAPEQPSADAATPAVEKNPESVTVANQPETAAPAAPSAPAAPKTRTGRLKGTLVRAANTAKDALVLTPEERAQRAAQTQTEAQAPAEQPAEAASAAEQVETPAAPPRTSPFAPSRDAVIRYDDLPDVDDSVSFDDFNQALKLSVAHMKVSPELWQRVGEQYPAEYQKYLMQLQNDTDDNLHPDTLDHLRGVIKDVDGSNSQLEENAKKRLVSIAAARRSASTDAGTQAPVTDNTPAVVSGDSVIRYDDLPDVDDSVSFDDFSEALKLSVAHMKVSPELWQRVGEQYPAEYQKYLMQLQNDADDNLHPDTLDHLKDVFHIVDGTESTMEEKVRARLGSITRARSKARADAETQVIDPSNADTVVMDLDQGR